MGRAKELIEKYGLRDECSVRGVVGPKMDDECIQAFIDNDPSGNCKYLDWMLLQAGGGTERLNKSVMQWEKGDHGESPVRDTLRERYVKDCMAGYTDEDGKYVMPVTEEVAIAQWEESECEAYKAQHVYGDEEYVLTGFGFYRSWPGNNALYEQIVQAVHRFHKYQQKLKSLGKSIDLNAANYPNLRDLQSALADITFLEIKNHVDCEEVYNDGRLLVVCPYNIGASLKHGHQKWCTANESMFKQAITGDGPNRWKEYAKDSALYYCRFTGASPKTNEGKMFRQIAIQAPFKGGSNSWKYFDVDDKSHTESEIIGLVHDLVGKAADESFLKAISVIKAHHKHYPTSRLNLEFVVKA